jgi:hypothetical protein
VCPDLCNFFEITSLTSREEDRKGKSKTVAVKGWTDLDGSKRLRLPDFMTVGT